MKEKTINKNLEERRKDRCRDCAYLVEKDLDWFCENSEEFCMNIEKCLAGM